MAPKSCQHSSCESPEKGARGPWRRSSRQGQLNGEASGPERCQGWTVADAVRVPSRGPRSLISSVAAMLVADGSEISPSWELLSAEGCFLSQLCVPRGQPTVSDCSAQPDSGSTHSSQFQPPREGRPVPGFAWGSPAAVTVRHLHANTSPQCPGSPTSATNLATLSPTVLSSFLIVLLQRRSSYLDRMLAFCLVTPTQP